MASLTSHTLYGTSSLFIKSWNSTVKKTIVHSLRCDIAVFISSHSNTPFIDESFVQYIVKFFMLSRNNMELTKTDLHRIAKQLRLYVTKIYPRHLQA